jgi:prepilin-type N-terminal cleavage/methylation domain-containing protein
MNEKGLRYKVQGSGKNFEFRISNLEICNSQSAIRNPQFTPHPTPYTSHLTPHDKKSGFTLLEVLVALVILSITFIWLLKAENQGIDMGLRSKFITTSTMLAEGRIAQVMSDPQIVKGEEKGDFGEEYKGYTYEEKMNAIPIVPDYWKYTLIIHWGNKKEEKENFETEFVTFLSGK